MQALYTAHATAHGGRDGRVASSDGILDLVLTSPKELGGKGGSPNPEMLFAAGYAGCFQSAMQFVARMQKIAAPASTVTADVSIGKQGEGFALAVKLNVSLPGMDNAAAEALVATAHKVCPYSNATRNNIPVELTVTT